MPTAASSSPSGRLGKHLAGQWEFPGGQDRGSARRPKTALVRELAEELGVDTSRELPRPGRLRQPPLPRFSPCVAAVRLPPVDRHAARPRRSAHRLAPAERAVRARHATGRSAVARDCSRRWSRRRTAGRGAAPLRHRRGPNYAPARTARGTTALRRCGDPRQRALAPDFRQRADELVHIGIAVHRRRRDA